MQHHFRRWAAPGVKLAEVDKAVPHISTRIVSSLHILIQACLLFLLSSTSQGKSAFPHLLWKAVLGSCIWKGKGSSSVIGGFLVCHGSDRLFIFVGFNVAGCAPLQCCWPPRALLWLLMPYNTAAEFFADVQGCFDCAHACMLVQSTGVHCTVGCASLVVPAVQAELP